MYDSKSQIRMISVIIPVYNVRAYLADCIRSVLSQTYKNLEIILLDDGSTDGSGELCDQWKKEDRRIRVIHQKNAGVSEARNAGILASTGDFLGFIDGDDWIEPEMYRELMESILQNQADIAMCGYYDYPNGMSQKVAEGVLPFPASGYEDSVVPVLQRNGYFTSMCNKLFARSLIFPEGKPILLDSGLAYGEDEAWFFTVFSRCKTASFVPKPLYHWRPREKSTTRTAEINEKHMSLLLSKRKALDLMPADPAVQKLARGRIFNDCHILKVYAYLSHRNEYYAAVSRQINPDKRIWLSSSDVPWARKTKVILLDLLMKLKAPVNLVQRISQIR